MKANWIDLIELVGSIWMTGVTLIVARIWILQRRALDPRAPGVGTHRLNWLMPIFLVWGIGGLILIAGLGLIAAWH